MNRLSASWCVSMNVGDCLTPYLIEKISGNSPIYAQGGADYEHYVFAGSMLNHAGAHSIVWGAGLGTITDGVNPSARLMAVRGPISRYRAITCGAKCPPVYGDPAILLPKFFKPDVKKSYGLGIVPHYVDHLRAYHWYEGRKVINVLQPVESFVSEILQCERIVSSSLHGIIIAHAYGIPALWVKFSDSIGGDGTKYMDYFASAGIDVTAPVDLSQKHDIPSFPSHVPDLSPMANLLWDACPIPAESRKGEYR